MKLHLPQAEKVLNVEHVAGTLRSVYVLQTVRFK